MPQYPCPDRTFLLIRKEKGKLDNDCGKPLSTCSTIEQIDHDTHF